MRITKFVHSCLLAETDDRVALIDPGVFSWKAGVFDIDKVERIDRIIITHQHPDHYHPEFVKTVLAKFPEAHIIANLAVQEQLKNDGIEATMRESSDCSRPFESSHEAVEPFAKTVPATGFHFKDQLTHPGDSHSFSEAKEILAMPIIAPWGTIMDGINKVLELKPKHIIPIHDWQYSDAAKQWAYDQMRPIIENAGIKLTVLEPGVPVEI